METTSVTVAVSTMGEKGQASPQLRQDGLKSRVEPWQSLPNDTDQPTRKWKWSKTTLTFFLMGILVSLASNRTVFSKHGQLTPQSVGLPTMPITTAASQMFEGITGVYGICLSLTAAVSSLAGPILGRYLPYDVCTVILTLASGLAYVVCTLPDPLGNATHFNKAGPVIGTIMAGFVYAFGTQTYLAVAAFFPSEAVIALSIGSGLSIIIGAGAYIGLVKGPFDQDWRRAFLCFLPTIVLMPLIWWLLFDKKRRQAAELSRRRSFRKSPDSSSASDTEIGISELMDSPRAINGPAQSHGAVPIKPGFGPNKTRASVLIKLILPRYVLPLIICTSCAIFSLFGLAPALQTLGGRFHQSPPGELDFQLIFFAYGSAQFLFSALVAIKPMPIIWIWTGVEVVLTSIALVQMWHPFLTYFGVWFVVMFFVGGCVGGSVTNTNFKIAEDFRKAGEPDEVRSFANSYAGLGNFGGDAVGGALGLVLQLVLVPQLKA